MTAPAPIPDLLSALQGVLSTEHAAVYGYGLAGGRLSGAEESAASAAFAVHESRRDAVRRLILDHGGQPIAALPAYRAAHPVVNRRTALQLAVAMEQDCATACALTLGATDDPAVRRSAAAWLADAAVRGQSWRLRLGGAAVATTPPLPGLALPTPTPTPFPTSSG